MREWGARAAAAARRSATGAARRRRWPPHARGAAVRGAHADGRGAPAREAAALVDALPDDELARRLDAAAHLAGAELYLHRFAEAQRARRAGAARSAAPPGRASSSRSSTRSSGMTGCFRAGSAEAVEPLDGAIEAARLTGNAQTLAWSLYAALDGRARPPATSTTALADRAGGGRRHRTTASPATSPAARGVRARRAPRLEIGKPERAVELLRALRAAARTCRCAAPSFRAAARSSC